MWEETKLEQTTNHLVNTNVGKKLSPPFLLGRQIQNKNYVYLATKTYFSSKLRKRYRKDRKIPLNKVKIIFVKIV